MYTVFNSQLCYSIEAAKADMLNFMGNPMLNGEDIRRPNCLALPFAEDIFHRAHFDSLMRSIQHEERRRYKNRNWKQKKKK